MVHEKDLKHRRSQTIERLLHISQAFFSSPHGGHMKGGCTIAMLYNFIHPGKRQIASRIIFAEMRLPAEELTGVNFMSHSFRLIEK